MKHKNQLPIVALLLAALFIAPVHAAEKSYLSKEQVDPIALLAPPPLPDSAEQSADIASVVAVNNAAAPGEIAAANSEKKFYIFNFAPAIGGFFRSNSLPKTAAFFQRVHVTVQGVVDAGKQHWKRPRPFVVQTNLSDGEMEATYSYPSGHSAKAMVFASLLAEIFPEKREEIFATGRSIGWHRVQIAAHYPTDIYAGRALGQAIARELKKNPAFEKDLAEVKKEIAEAQRAEKSGAKPSVPAK